MALTWPLQVIGNTGEPVRSVQHLLRAHGDSVNVDGTFGPLTEGAVKAFQTANGLVADGKVGNLTWPLLIVAVKNGSAGEAVRAVQDQAQFRNLSGDPSNAPAVDGIFGPKTTAWVTGFQQALHADDPSVTVDGIVGPVTWNYLVKEALSL